jgi:hypothetical protein
MAGGHARRSSAPSALEFVIGASLFAAPSSRRSQRKKEGARQHSVAIPVVRLSNRRTAADWWRTGYAATGIASQLTAEHVAVQPGVLVVHRGEERWPHAIHTSEFLRLNEAAGIVHLLNTFPSAGGCSDGVTRHLP